MQSLVGYLEIKHFRGDRHLYKLLYFATIGLQPSRSEAAVARAATQPAPAPARVQPLHLRKPLPVPPQQLRLSVPSSSRPASRVNSIDQPRRTSKTGSNRHRRQQKQESNPEYSAGSCKGPLTPNPSQADPFARCRRSQFKTLPESTHVPGGSPQGR